MLPEKDTYRMFLILTKFMPILLSIVYMLYSVFSLFGVNVDWLHYTCSVSLIPLVYFYSSSKTLQFCVCHRLFIHYMTICDIVTIAQDHLNKFKNIVIDPAVIHKIRIVIYVILVVILFWHKSRHGLVFCIKQHNK